MKISNVEEFNKNKVRITIEDGTCLVLYKSKWEEIAKNNPDENEALDLPEEILDSLWKEYVLLGKKRAMHLLERKDYIRAELQRKLSEDGYEGICLDEIFCYLDKFHYIDDVRLAGVWIRSRMKAQSKKQIEYFLRQKGVSELDITVAMEENYLIEDSDIGAEELAIKNQIEKMHVDMTELDYNEKQKIAAKLYRKGFDSSLIRRVLQG